MQTIKIVWQKNALLLFIIHFKKKKHFRVKKFNLKIFFLFCQIEYLIDFLKLKIFLKKFNRN